MCEVGFKLGVSCWFLYRFNTWNFTLSPGSLKNHQICGTEVFTQGTEHMPPDSQALASGTSN